LAYLNKEEMVNLDLGVKLDDSWSSYTPSLDWFKWTTNQIYSQKYIFQIALKCERKTKRKFVLKIKIGSGPFFRHGRGRSPIFFLCGLMKAKDSTGFI
jgi:hypothetical protein